MDDRLVCKVVKRLKHLMEEEFRQFAIFDEGIFDLNQVINAALFQCRDDLQMRV